MPEDYDKRTQRRIADRLQLLYEESNVKITRSGPQDYDDAYYRGKANAYTAAIQIALNPDAGQPVAQPSPKTHLATDISELSHVQPGANVMLYYGDKPTMVTVDRICKCQGYQSGIAVNTTFEDDLDSWFDLSWFTPEREIVENDELAAYADTLDSRTHR